MIHPRDRRPFCGIRTMNNAKLRYAMIAAIVLQSVGAIAQEGTTRQPVYGYTGDLVPSIAVTIRAPKSWAAMQAILVRSPMVRRQAGIVRESDDLATEIDALIGPLFENHDALRKVVAETLN